MDELAQRRAAAEQTAIRSQVEPNVTYAVIERENATRLAESTDTQKQHVERTVATPTIAPVQSQKDTMYHLYERAVVESYERTPPSSTAETSASYRDVPELVSKQQATKFILQEGLGTVVVSNNSQVEANSNTCSNKLVTVPNNHEIADRPSATEGGIVVPSAAGTEPINPTQEETFATQESPLEMVPIRQQSECVQRIKNTCAHLTQRSEAPVDDSLVGRMEEQSCTVTDKTLEEQQGSETETKKVEKVAIGTSVHHHVNKHGAELHSESDVTSHVTEIKIEALPEHDATDVSRVVTNAASSMISSAEILSNKNALDERKMVTAAQTHFTTRESSDSVQRSEKLMKNPGLVQSPVSGVTGALGKSPIQHNNVCHDSEIGDVSGRVSISPRLSVPYARNAAFNS